MFIADACALLAYFGGDGRTMGRAGMDAMRADVWELSLNVAAGKLPPLPTERDSFAKHLAALRLREVPLLCGDAEAANALRRITAIRWIACRSHTALRTGLTVITNDAVFPAYGVTTVW